MMDESYTPKETQKILKIGQTTFFSLVKTGKLKTFTIGKSRRVRGSEIARIQREGA